ncbi:uncharacterized protein LOC120817419 isoform X2 [Gasterosteus aculeatus]
MQHSQRLDQRLHTLREEVRTMTHDKERGEQVWRDRLQRCQRQLKAKEEEMSRQSLYFENFKTQLQHKLSLARDREQSLQNRIYTLEKQLLDVTVRAVTDTASIGAVRITAETVTRWEEPERLPPTRGQGEGEEERKEERKRQWQPSVGYKRGGGLGGDQETQGERVKEAQSNEARLQGFILSLQQDLKVLLEREEGGMTERRGLMEQLQEVQENSHFLDCKVEDMRAEVQRLKLSEQSLMGEVEELKEENHRLQPESTWLGPGSNTLSYATTTGHSSVGSFGEAHLPLDEGAGRPHSSAVSPLHHQEEAESLQNNAEDRSPSAPSESTPPKVFCPRVRSLSLTTETLEEFRMGTWCCKGVLNLEKSPSEESDALREAYRSLGLEKELEAHQEQRVSFEVDRLQVSKEVRESEMQQRSSREKICALSAGNGAEDAADLPLAQGDLVWALNQENRLLAERIQELVAHIELREEEVKRAQTQLMERIFKLEGNRVRLERESQEQECLITELTKKTEDDLNTIMELQQRLEESEQRPEESQVANTPRGSQLQSEPTAALSGSFQEQNLEDCVDSLVECVLNGEEPQGTSAQQLYDSTAASAPSSPRDNHYGPLQNSLLISLRVSSLTDREKQLTRSVQRLKADEEELSGCINALREQQREVALSVQTQTEDKQQLTRTVWGLKEEKDSVSQSLAGVKQEREQLTRTVCGLRDERDQLIRFMRGLKEEKESLSGLEREKEKLLESLSSGKEERDQIMQSLRSLHTESDQLSQSVLHLRGERDELTNSLKCLKERREEKESVEHSISCLKQEEKQIELLLQGLREERNVLSPAPPGRTQAEGIDRRPLNPNCAVAAEKCASVVGTGATRRRPAHGQSSAQEEQSDLRREIEALGEKLKRSRDDLDKSRVDTEFLGCELRRSEAAREEAERKAAAAKEELVRWKDKAHQMEETREENDSLTTQVEELQRKVGVLITEKTAALALKAQEKEQYNVLTAELKAKTVALEELNSEYIALKRSHDSKDDASDVLVSLRTRYKDIRAKYDALKKKSQSDVEVAPLKAKLSCLVEKCQERNSLLVQMMRAMRRHDCVDSALAHQVERLLRDATLQNYTAAFTPSSRLKTQDYAGGLTGGFVSKFEDYAGGSTTDQTCSTASAHVQQQRKNGFKAESGVRSEKPRSLVSTEADGGDRQPKESGPHHSDTEETSSLDPTGSTGSPVSPTPPSSGARYSPSRRLSSPEKIMNMYEQLQQTLMSSYQSPESRGRGRQPGKSLSFPSSADLHSASETTKQSFCSNVPPPDSLPLSAALSPAKHTNRSTTLFDAVASRSANITSSPNMFACCPFKTTSSAVSGSSDLPFSTKDKSIPSRGTDIKSPEPAKKTPAIPAESDPRRTCSTPLTPRTATVDSDVLTCPKTTASDTTAPSSPTAPQANPFLTPSITDGATPARHGLVLAASCARPARCSPERSSKPGRKSTAALGRPTPEAPAEVQSVEVIKTVGQGSLMIGWERPPLDELGCSNGTFVYGYRVFVDGDFHKSVMSSACTKCVLENVNLRGPVHVSVQTLGSNGLSSDFVHTTHVTSVKNSLSLCV